MVITVPVSVMVIVRSTWYQEVPGVKPPVYIVKLLPAEYQGRVTGRAMIKITTKLSWRTVIKPCF